RTPLVEADQQDRAHENVVVYHNDTRGRRVASVWLSYLRQSASAHTAHASWKGRRVGSESLVHRTVCSTNQSESKFSTLKATWQTAAQRCVGKQSGCWIAPR